MRREMIEKVVRKAAELNVIDLNDCTLTSNERHEEIVSVLQNEIDKDNKLAIESLLEGFTEFVMNLKESTVKDEETGEQRPLNIDEIIEVTISEFCSIYEGIDELLNE